MKTKTYARKGRSEQRANGKSAKTIKTPGKLSKAKSMEESQTSSIVGPRVLSGGEKDDLQRCEQKIVRFYQALFEKGKALKEIRERKLYRDSYKTFESYCEERWEIQRLYAYRLIRAAEMLEILFPIGNKIPLPARETQVRPLTDLDADQATMAWEKAVTQANGKEVTAKDVQRVVSEVVGAKGHHVQSSGSGEMPYYGQLLCESANELKRTIRMGDYRKVAGLMEKMKQYSERLAGFDNSGTDSTIP